MRVSTWAAATLVWILLASGACLAHLIAQTGAPSAEPAAADKAGKELHALRISANAASIRLDGRIDDEGWMRAQVISDLTQEDPDNMMAPTDSMTVRVAYDDRYIYVAVQMAMRDVSELRDGLGRRGSAPWCAMVCAVRAARTRLRRIPASGANAARSFAAPRATTFPG